MIRMKKIFILTMILVFSSDVFSQITYYFHYGFGNKLTGYKLIPVKKDLSISRDKDSNFIIKFSTLNWGIENENYCFKVKYVGVNMYGMYVYKGIGIQGEGELQVIGDCTICSKIKLSFYNSKKGKEEMEKEKEREGEYFGGFKWCSIFSFKIFFDNRVCIDKKTKRKYPQTEDRMWDIYL